jgi:hypothetical protein
VPQNWNAPDNPGQSPQPFVQPHVQESVQQPGPRTYKTAARRQKSTVIHGILTVLTCGLWSPVWLLACAENSRIRKAQAAVAMYEASWRRH